MTFINDGRFEKFKDKVWLSSPTMYPDSMHYVMEAYKTNWMSTVGENIDRVEKEICKIVGCKYSVALSYGTSSFK